MDYEAILEQLLYSENSEELFQKYKGYKNVMKLYLPLRPERYSETPSKIRKNIEICKEIIKNDPLFFKNLEFEMRCYHELSELAVDLHSENFKYVIGTNPEWDRNLLLSMLKKEYKYSAQSVSYNYDYTNFALDWYGDDKEVILAWLKHDTSILKIIDKKYLSDIDVAMTAVENYGLSIFVFSNEILRNKDCVIKAIKNTPVVFDKLPDDNPLKNDEDVINVYNSSIVKLNINDILNYMDSSVKKDYDYGVELQMPYIIEKSYTRDEKEQMCSIINAMLLYEDPYIFQTAISSYRVVMNSFEFITSEILGVKTKKIIKYCDIDSIYENIKNDDSIELSQVEIEIIENLKGILGSRIKTNDEDHIEKAVNTINKLK